MDGVGVRGEGRRPRRIAQRSAARATLRLEDGTELDGRAFAAARAVAGEVVFNTGMTGYVEALTDPSYRGQILVLTYPLVGNYGVPAPRAPRQPRPPLRVRAASRCRGWSCSTTSTRTATTPRRRSLGAWLAAEGVPGVTGVDTRTLTRRLREHGTMRGWLLPGDDERATRRSSGATRSTCSDEVFRLGRAPRAPIRYEGGTLTILLVDAGAKDNIVRSLLARGATVRARALARRSRARSPTRPTAS